MHVSSKCKRVPYTNGANLSSWLFARTDQTVTGQGMHGRTRRGCSKAQRELRPTAARGTVPRALDRRASLPGSPVYYYPAATPYGWGGIGSATDTFFMQGGVPRA